MAERMYQNDYRQGQRRAYEPEDRFDQESGYRGAARNESESEWGRRELGRPWDQESGYRNEPSGQHSEAGMRSSWSREAGRYGEGEYRQQDRFGQLSSRQQRGGDWRDQQDWQNPGQYSGQRRPMQDYGDYTGEQRYGQDYGRYTPQQRYIPDYGRYTGQSERYGDDYGQTQRYWGDRGYAGDEGRGYSGQNWQQQFGQPQSNWRGQSAGERRYEGGSFPSYQQDRFGDYYGRQAGLEDQRRWPAPGPYAGKGPKDYSRADDDIRKDACELLTRHGGIDASDINVSVHNGDITLSGNVPDKHMRREAEDALEGMSGVKDVNNQLRINNRPAYDSMRDDKQMNQRGQESHTMTEEQQRQAATTARQ